MLYRSYELVQDLIAQDSSTHGVMFCLFVLDSDKTTVSIATDQNEYYPLYISPDAVYNSTRYAQWNAVCLVTFLAISKSE